MRTPPSFRKPQGARWAPILLALLAACGPADGPLRVGVMLPLSGPGDLGWREPLELALSRIREAGGPAGRPLELVYRDLALEDPKAVARAFLDDDSVVAVIGPDSSTVLMAVAPAFIEARKPLVSPSATSGEVFRALGGKSYVWRIVQSDVAQAQAMLVVAIRSGAQRVALVCPDDPYGATFFDWVGFLGTEAGIEVTGLFRYTPGTDPAPAVAEALGTGPDALLVVPASRDDAVTLVRSARRTSPGTALVLSDMGAFPALIQDLGDLAEGIEGTAPAPDPAGGFEVAFQVLYGRDPPPYAAHVFDALTLLAFGLEASGGRGGEDLVRGLEAVVDGRGAPTRWDFDGVAKTLEAIRAGEQPDLAGASGPLDFDRELYTDPVVTFYGRWRVEHGRFVPVETLSTGDAGRALSLDDSLASERLIQDVTGGSFQPGPRTGAWALVAALSSDWSNYRHQADALAQYQLLRKNGLPDDRIVLVLADDLAGDPQNAEPGVVRNVTGGPNLRDGADVDYRTTDLGATDLLAILAGQASDRLPDVIGSGPGDDVYVFLVGHGDTDGALVDSKAAGDRLLTPEALAATVQDMWDQGRYRRVMIAVETCHGGVLGTRLTAPGAVLLAGASPVESSFGANYDLSLGVWLGDQFAFGLVGAAATRPDQRLDELYRDLFLHVSGSHVSMYNAQGFGGAGSAVFGDFLGP